MLQGKCLWGLACCYVPPQEKKTSLTAQLDKLTASDGAGNGAVSEEEWRQKYEAMKAALPQYKKMKKELGDIEVGS